RGSVRARNVDLLVGVLLVVDPDADAVDLDGRAAAVIHAAQADAKVAVLDLRYGPGAAPQFRGSANGVVLVRAGEATGLGHGEARARPVRVVVRPRRELHADAAAAG